MAIFHNTLTDNRSMDSSHSLVLLYSILSIIPQKPPNPHMAGEIMEGTREIAVKLTVYDNIMKILSYYTAEC